MKTIAVVALALNVLWFSICAAFGVFNWFAFVLCLPALVVLLNRP